MVQDVQRSLSTCGDDYSAVQYSGIVSHIYIASMCLQPKKTCERHTNIRAVNVALHRSLSGWHFHKKVQGALMCCFGVVKILYKLWALSCIALPARYYASHYLQLYILFPNTVIDTIPEYPYSLCIFWDFQKIDIFDIFLSFYIITQKIHIMLIILDY